MSKMVLIILAIVPCLLFGQTQDVPTYEELDKTMEASLGKGELVKKPKPKKKAKKSRKKQLKKTLKTREK